MLVAPRWTLSWLRRFTSTSTPIKPTTPAWERWGGRAALSSPVTTSTHPAVATAAIVIVSLIKPGATFGLAELVKRCTFLLTRFLVFMGCFWCLLLVNHCLPLCLTLLFLSLLFFHSSLADISLRLRLVWKGMYYNSHLRFLMQTEQLGILELSSSHSKFLLYMSMFLIGANMNQYLNILWFCIKLWPIRGNLKKLANVDSTRKPNQSTRENSSSCKILEQ